jgi:hypothetical protein
MAVPPLVPVLPLSQIQERLQVIFTAGTPHRNFVIRDIAVKTLFVMLYLDAVEGTEYWVRPDQVTRMTDEQAALTADADRQTWQKESLLPARESIPGRWYAGNTRESIRDETLRKGLLSLGAATEREGLPTTSSKGRYVLTPGFAALFDPGLDADVLQAAIDKWQAAYLSPEALARVDILRHAAVAGKLGVRVSFPGGEARVMEPGPSSVLSKAVIENFAACFLERPSVIWLSESRNKVVKRDDELLHRIGLNIPTDRLLPDLILVDVGSNPVDVGPNPLLLVFVEVVATAGAFDETRHEALLGITSDASFSLDHVAFVTAYEDRDSAAFKNSVGALPWRSFVWFMSNPTDILVLHRASAARHVRLSELMKA